MRVGLAQINTTVGDIWGNVEKMADALERATEAGADLVAFPELAIPGYPPEDLLLRSSFIEDNLRGLEELAGSVPEGVAAAVGFVDLDGDLYNACAVVSGGQVLYRYHKRYLPNYGVFDENRYFREGSRAPVLRMDDALVGVTVCEDMWYPGGPAREQALVGASVLLNINGSPYHRQKILSRERMLRVRASDYGCYVVWCNLVGGQDELVFDGASVIMGPDGDVISRARQFEEDLLLADIHPEAALIHRLHDP
ncbi:MAG: nitrilase-related carbon-nitrogen hydrolase, partial [Rubrobacter sp.]